jgi:glutaredoxin
MHIYFMFNSNGHGHEWPAFERISPLRVARCKIAGGKAMEGSFERAERDLLMAFDAPGAADSKAALDVGAIAVRDGSRPLDEWRAIAEALAARGLLRRAEDGDTYVRTEDGRLAVASPLDVTLYTRPGCHLCEEAKVQIAPVLAKAGARLREVNIDDDPVLRERYNVDVPVIFLGARKVAKHRVDLAQFRRQLEEAGRRP